MSPCHHFDSLTSQMTPPAVLHGLQLPHYTPLNPVTVLKGNRWSEWRTWACIRSHTSTQRKLFMQWDAPK